MLLYFSILEVSNTEEETGTPGSTKTNTLVTPQKNVKRRKNTEGMGDIDDVMTAMTVLPLICFATKY